MGPSILTKLTTTVPVHKDINGGVKLKPCVSILYFLSTQYDIYMYIAVGMRVYVGLEWCAHVHAT